MAAAPLESKKKQNPLLSLFTGVSFKLPAKPGTPFKNDDGSESTRMAYALITMGRSGLQIRANIYQRIIQPKQAGGKATRETYLAMPSAGKGFPQPVFTVIGEEPATQALYDAWRYDVAMQYKAWKTGLEQQRVADGGEVIQHSLTRLVEEI
jgi:hypothetical protein